MSDKQERTDVRVLSDIVANEANVFGKTIAKKSRGRQFQTGGIVVIG
jgi:hypothetical protein